jgi:hypothetical protein
MGSQEHHSTLICDLYDTEAVAVGIFQHDKILIRVRSPRIPSRPDLEQPLHFALLVVCVEVQVYSTRFSDALKRFWNLVQRHVGSFALRVTKNYPAATSRLSGNAVKRFLPERQHSVKFVTANDNRTDSHFSVLAYSRLLNEAKQAFRVNL